MTNLALRLLPLVLCLSAAGARADDWTITIGAGALYKPAFVGSGDYQAMAFPDVKLQYRDRFFASPFEGIGYNVINGDGWRAGPIVKYDFGRAEDDDSPFRIAGRETTALKGLGDVDGTVEAGGFVEYAHEPFSAMLELRQGIGGHEGFVGEAGLSYTGAAEGVVYAAGPRVTFADANYNTAYFGIDAAQSAASGLARHEAGFGIVSYGIGGFAAMPVTDSVTVGVFAAYDRLAGDAADSPLVTRRGDENQFTGGLRVSYALGF